MGQFLPPKGQLLPATIADVKSRLRRVEHQIEKVNAKPGTDTGGIEVTFSASIPSSAAIGDVWYKTSGNSVIAQYQCATAYSNGNGTQADWTTYTVDGSAITSGTVANAQLAEAAVESTNLAPAAVTSAAIATAAVTLDAVDTSTVTARTLGGSIVTFGTTEPTSPQNGDVWVETDSTGAVNSMWSYNSGAWVEATISESTAGGIKVTASTTAPASPNAGDLWINQSQGNLLEQWDGSSWVSYQYGAGAIASGAVGNTQLASNAVAAGNIQTGAVGNTQLASNAVASGNIQTGAVGTTQLASNAVTAAKIANNTITSAQISATAGITSGQVSFTASQIGGISVTVGTTAPANPNVNDLWYDASNGYVLNVYGGSSTGWTPYQYGTNAIQAGSVTSALIAAQSITSNLIASDVLDGATINALTINGGSINAADFIMEPGNSNGLYGYGTPPPTTFTITATGSGTWKCPPGVATAKVECWGAGGGGGGSGWTSSTAYGAGAGGGGGEYACEPALAVTAGTTYSYSIGAGGAPGGADSPPNQSDETGKAGGNTTFTGASKTVTAHGGSGGGGGMFGAVGGAGGTGSTNTVHYNGGTGGGNGANAGKPGYAGGGGGSAGSSSAGRGGQTATASGYGAGGAAVAFGGSGGYGVPPTNSIAFGGSPTSPGGGGGGGGADSAEDLTTGDFGAAGWLRITYSVASGSTPQLLLSIAAVAGNDPYGTAVGDGFSAYDGAAKAQLHINQSLGLPALELYSGMASEQVNPAIYVLPSNKGLVNERETLHIAGPAAKYTSGAQNYISIENQAADGSYLDNINFCVGGTGDVFWLGNTGSHFGAPVWGMQIAPGTVISATDPSTATTTKVAETWHSLTVPSGWSGYIRYKLTAWNTVMVQWEVSGGNATLNWTIGTLPALYRPVKDFKTAAGVYATASSNQIIRCNISTGGAISALGSGLTINEFDGFAEVPLD